MRIFGRAMVLAITAAGAGIIVLSTESNIRAETPEEPAVAEELDPADIYEYYVEPNLCNPIVSDGELALAWCRADATRLVNAAVGPDRHPLYRAGVLDAALEACEDDTLDELVIENLSERAASYFTNDEIEALLAEQADILLATEGVNLFNATPEQQELLNRNLDIIDRIDDIRAAEQQRLEEAMWDFTGGFSYEDAIASLRADCPPNPSPSPTSSPTPTPNPEPSPSPSASPTPAPTPEPSPSPTADPSEPEESGSSSSSSSSSYEPSASPSPSSSNYSSSSSSG